MPFERAQKVTFAHFWNFCVFDFLVSHRALLMILGYVSGTWCPGGVNFRNLKHCFTNNEKRCDLDASQKVTFGVFWNFCVLVALVCFGCVWICLGMFWVCLGVFWVCFEVFKVCFWCGWVCFGCV